MSQEISRFRGKYGFLSNMHSCHIEVFGSIFDNAEAAFQSQKEPDLTLDFMDLTGPEAKKAGRKVNLRSDWDSVKDTIMEEVIRAKFNQNSELREQLIATDDALIMEGNTWHDNYWGICTCERCGERGQNNLGKLLMKIRDELRPPPYQERLLTGDTTTVAYTPSFIHGYARLVCTTNPEVTIGKHVFYWVLHVDKMTLEKRYGKWHCYAVFGPSPFLNLGYRGGEMIQDNEGLFTFVDDEAKEVYKFSLDICKELHDLYRTHYGYE